MHMWKKTFFKLKGGVKIKLLWANMHKHMLHMGTTHNLNALAKGSSRVDDCCGKLIMAPDNDFHRYWDPVMVLLLLYTAFFVPYKIAFLTKDPLGIQISEKVVDVLFFLDIFVNFLTGYEDVEKNILIVEPNLIAKQYILGWFWLDVGATFPVDLLVETLGLEGNSKELKLARLTRMYRLIRAVRLLRMAKILRLGNTGLSKWIEMF
jgi:hypothetical protein